MVSKKLVHLLSHAFRPTFTVSIPTSARLVDKVRGFKLDAGNLTNANVSWDIIASFGGEGAEGLFFFIRLCNITSVQK